MKKIYYVAFLFFLVLGFANTLPVHAQSTTYNFEDDTIGQTPAGLTVTAGTFDVQEASNIGKSMRAVTKVGVIAGAIFDNFASSSDQSIVWKQAYSTNLGRGGFTLRAQAQDTSVPNSAGARLGYLFHVYDNTSLYIWKVTDDSYIELWSGALAKSEPRWFRAEAIGEELTFSYSDDGENYTELTTVTDTTYTSGLVQYTAGYGQDVNQDYIDDIVITNLDSTELTGSGTEEDPYQLTECYTITESGYYILTQNLSTTGDCITIEADDVTVDGDGYTIQGNGSVLTQGIILEGYNTTTIRDITIDNFYDGIMFWNNVGSTISGVTITSSTDDAMDLHGVRSLTILNSNIVSSSDDGIEIHPYESDGGIVYSRNITIRNSTISNITDNGIEVDYVEGFTLTGGTIHTVEIGNAIQIHTIDENRSTDITISDIEIYDISIDGDNNSAITVVGAETVDITNTQITNVYQGINIDAATDVLVQQNNVSKARQDGIELGDVTDADILHNEVTSTGSDGIYVSNGINIVISENTIDDINSDGIDFSGDENINITITDNILTNIGDNGVELDEVYVATITRNSMEIAGDGISVNDSADIEFSNNVITPSLVIHIEIPQIETDALVLDIESAEASITDTDDGSFTYTLPFTMNFMGRNIVAIEPSSNGAIELLEAGEDCEICSSYGSYSSYFVNNDVIFSSFDDLDTYDDGYVTVFSVDDESGEYVVVEFYGSTLSDNNEEENNYIKIQTILYPTGEIEWNFLEMNFETYYYNMFTGVYDFEDDQLYTAGFAINEVSSYGGDFSGDGEFELVESLNENIGLDLDDVSNSTFIGNNIRAFQWVYGIDLSAVVFNDNNSGNTYYFVDGTESWSVFDIVDSTGNNYADSGADRPFSSSTLGIALWEGEGQDAFPFTRVSAPRASRGSTYIPPSRPRITNRSFDEIDTDEDGARVSGAFTINAGAATTNNRTVTLTFIDIENVSHVAISESPSFAGVSFQTFAANLSYTLSTGNEEKTVYAKLRSPEGATLTLKDTIVLTNQAVAAPTTPTPVTPINPNQALQCTSSVFLTSPVGPGRVNAPADVRLLEEFLNTYENANLPVNGIYEQADFDAVVRWQEKYAADILAPWGLTQGSGFVFTTSLAKIKEIHEANCATATPAPAPQPTQPSTTPAQCLSTTQTLSLGMNNEAVRIAQQLLKKLGFFPADIDTTGFFGPVTETAVRAFQAANSIDQLGIIGPQTRARLNELGCE